MTGFVNFVFRQLMSRKMGEMDYGSEQELIQAAAEEGIRVYGLSDYQIHPGKEDQATILLGYANLTEGEIREAAGRLVEVWRKF